MFNEEELETETISGIYPTFRCATRIDEGSTIIIQDQSFEVQHVMHLEFGESLHILSAENDA